MEAEEKAMPKHPTLATLATDLDAGRTTARKLVEECLARIADPAGEGARTFIHVDKDAAIAAADAMDQLRKVKAAPSPFAGIPVSIKDLFDIRGQVTRAGSRALEDSAPAEADAPAVARLRAAGFVVIGRTNMTEFAYSGIGINPHFGTPKSACQSQRRACARRFVVGCRGIDRRRHGVWRARHRYRRLLPDSGGLQRHRRLQADASAVFRSTAACRCRSRSTATARLARSVACCATLDAVLADEPVQPLQPRSVKGMRLAVPTTMALDDLDDAVAKTFDRALAALSRAGALIERIEVPEFLDVGMMNAKGGFAASESYAWHRYLIESKGDVYDPRVRIRILRGEGISAADYIDLLNMRRSFIARTRKAHRALRRAGAADHGQYPAENRRSCRRQGLYHRKPPRPAQLHADQHARWLRDLSACASRRRGAGRPDAGGSGRIGSPHF